MNIFTEINQLRNLIKNVRCSATEVLLSDTIIEGDIVTGCYKIAINTTTEQIFYRNNSNIWTIIETSNNSSNTE